MTDDAPSDQTISLASDAALVVIDVQRGFDEPSYWGPRNNPGFERNLKRLIDAWQASGRPIVVVRHNSNEPGSPLRPDQPGNDLVDAVAAIEPALFVSKTVNSAFYGTPDLRAWLEGRQIEQLVICGIQTNMCVETTARMAGNLGFDVLVPLDATHTFDLVGSDGVALTADQLATATAVNLSGGEFARVLSTASLLQEQ
ncbi:MAG: cysteine hydrolase family protein [Lacisediminihabitans sp.]